MLRADGYARAEAINACYVKRLDHATRDGNPIRGIGRSTGTDCDGKSAGLSHPSPESHEALIHRTYEAAGINDFCQIALVECHGTGTATGMILTFLSFFFFLSKYINSDSLPTPLVSVGDPLETSAIGNVGNTSINFNSLRLLRKISLVIRPAAMDD